MGKLWNQFGWILTTLAGSAVFALGLSLFLVPNAVNTGGISGLAMVAAELLGWKKICVITSMFVQKISAKQSRKLLM